jgi:hypothetical protein
MSLSSLRHLRLSLCCDDCYLNHILKQSGLSCPQLPTPRVARATRNSTPDRWWSGTIKCGGLYATDCFGGCKLFNGWAHGCSDTRGPMTLMTDASSITPDGGLPLRLGCRKSPLVEGIKAYARTHQAISSKPSASPLPPSPPSPTVIPTITFSTMFSRLIAFALASAVVVNAASSGFRPASALHRRTTHQVTIACGVPSDPCVCPSDLNGDSGVLINVFPGYQCAYPGGACTWNDKVRLLF